MGAMLLRFGRFLLLATAAKLLGPDEFGFYSYMLSLVLLGFMVGDFGVNILMVRDYGKEGLSKSTIVATSAFLKVGFSVVSFALGLVIILASGNSKALFLGTLLLLVQFIQNIREVYVQVAIAEVKNTYELLANIVDMVWYALCFFIFFYPNPSAYNLALVTFVGTVPSLFVSDFLIRKLVKFSFRDIDFNLLKSYLWKGLFLAPFGIVGFAFFNVSQLFLKEYGGFADVGIYAIASKIILALSMVPNLLVTVALPFLSSDARSSFGSKKLNRELMVALIVMGVLGCIGIIATSPFIVPYLLSESFNGAVRPTQILSSVFFLLCISGGFDYILFAHGKERVNLAISIFAVILCVGLNAVLVPMYGLMGAVYSSVVAQAVNVVCTFWYLRKLVI